MHRAFSQKQLLFWRFYEVRGGSTLTLILMLGLARIELASLQFGLVVRSCDVVMLCLSRTVRRRELGQREIVFWGVCVIVDALRRQSILLALNFNLGRP
jgi:hypothetical protein